MVVVVEEVDRGCYEEGRMPQARVVEVLGDIQDERTQIEMATWGQDIPKHFSDATPVSYTHLTLPTKRIV